MDSPAAEGSGDNAIIATLDEARRRFLALVDGIRPELHRYCTRMTGSVADGEDVVQDTLARAYYELSDLKALPPLRPWLFRIAHNRAIDHWRHESLRAAQPLEAAMDVADDDELEPDNALARRQAVQAALSCFLQLPPAQRGCVILKDVLDHSLEDIAAELEMSVPAVKAALHRGRVQLRVLSQEAASATPKPSMSPERVVSPLLRRYATLFNAHDWDAVRAMLADEVRLDLVARHSASGRAQVGRYFANYERLGNWRVEPAWLEGREVLAVFWREHGVERPGAFVELKWRDEHIVAIRDFHFVPYIAQEAVFESVAQNTG
ncbi:sigma-70 family RNA polymerase sigma factor [Variovorax sp. J22R133]|uniref:sigma-70 family RNA polymerase sigma factor n=1 Tax=Variovorax brevis TaxID=3053503 RepID=UPI002577BD02|nr:sigma-70 family RNA polymerase sigma factor [Variovorax sp. J22R133]MDM0111021.1 sigma-70 family RNA polymerase sigma factor [Variovorax sp. J22R133]